jgi:hypothetical protein
MHYVTKCSEKSRTNLDSNGKCRCVWVRNATDVRQSFSTDEVKVKLWDADKKSRIQCGGKHE